MVEQQTQTGTTMKVYELAKELGVDSISLVDKLGTLNIKVKNHMSDLAEADIRLARESLMKKAETAGAKKPAAKKATTTRKKVEAPAEAAAPVATAKAKTVTRTAAKVDKVETPDTGAAAREAAAAAAAKSSSGAIIRRRVKATDDGNEIATSTIIKKTADGTTSEQTFAQGATAAQEAAAHASAQAAAEAMGDTPTAEEIEAAEAAEAQGAEESEHEGVEASSAEPSSASEVQELPKTIAPFTRPVAPRKSFLKIVEATAPPPKPRMASPITPAGAIRPAGSRPTPTPGATDANGFRIIKMTKENLDQMAEEENQKKKGIGGGRLPGAGEIKPEDVRFADYRKKEMVFLPKRKKIPLGKELKRTEKTVAAQHKRVVEMGDTITVSEFASQLNTKGADVIRKLMKMGTMATLNQSIDFDTATLVAAEYQYEVKNVAFKEETMIDTGAEQDASKLVTRPPVVTIMGHVDHGKTSLLDALRSANVAAGEHGGITQHIGAYTVEKNGQLITFIDTPGHEAFTAMRARGANVTDIVILVVAADDAVMPQTREALSHAKAAGVPIIVAVNKIDKPGANPERVKQQLAELDLLAEDWGGQTMFIPVSALKKTGLSELLDAILLNSEVLDLKADPTGQGQGVVLEARLEKGRGPVASALVKRGTLRVGDSIVSAQFTGRVKALTNDKGETVKQALPGVAVEILGFEGLPPAGERFDVVADDRAAQELVSNRRLRDLQAKQASAKGATLDDLFAKMQEGTVKELNVILKADVSGSVEAVKDSLLKLSTDKIKVKVLYAAPGGITETDVLLATASKALIIGFNVRPETKARQIAESEHVEIKSYNIIYELIDEVKLAMTGMLDKKKVEKFLGRAEVRQVFSVPKIGTVAGCGVIDGKMVRNANVRLLRDSRILYDGKLNSLRRFKDDAKEVATGFECGMGLENYNDLKIGDLIEAYTIELIAPELNS